jgi:hypothetical protein
MLREMPEKRLSILAVMEEHQCWCASPLWASLRMRCLRVVRESMLVFRKEAGAKREDRGLVGSYI